MGRAVWLAALSLLHEILHFVLPPKVDGLTSWFFFFWSPLYMCRHLCRIHGRPTSLTATPVAFFFGTCAFFKLLNRNLIFFSLHPSCRWWISKRQWHGEFWDSRWWCGLFVVANKFDESGRFFVPSMTFSLLLSQLTIISPSRYSRMKRFRATQPRIMPS